MTPARRAVAAALLFLAAAVTAGIVLRPDGVGYRMLGITEGILALLLAFVFQERRVWERPAGMLGWIAVAYGTLASAQLLEMLLPARGVLEWVVVLGLLVVFWAALGTPSRRRLVASLAGVAILLALLKFSVIPLLWEHSGPAPGEAFGLGNLAESVRRLVVDHEPVRPAGELLGVVAIGIWTLGTRLLWPAGGEEEDWLAALPEGIRRRLASDPPPPD